jgi:iron complex outermembrane receptor protein
MPAQRLTLYTSIALIFISIELCAQIDTTGVALDTLFTVDLTETENVDAASKYSQPSFEAPTSITIVGSEEIENYGYTTVNELLKAQRGFYETYSRQYTTIGIRGFNRVNDYNSRILVLFDGHRLNIFDGAPLGSDLSFDMSNIERVEVIRGPGSALYGTNAMLGIINIIPKKREDLKITGRYGSFDSKKLSFNGGRTITDKFGFSVNATLYDTKGEDLYYEEFDSEETNYGIAQNLDYERTYGIYGRLYYSELELKAFASFRRKGNPTGSFFSDFNKKSETLDKYQFFELSYKMSFSYDKFIRARLFYDMYDFNGLYYVKLFGFNGFGSAQNLARSVGFEAQFIWDVLQNNRIITGIEYKHDLEKKIYMGMPGVTVLNINHHMDQFSYFIQNEYQYSSRLSFYAGLRIDTYNPTHDLFNAGRTVLNPRFSINYAYDEDNIFRLSYGAAFRENNIYERYIEVPFLYKKNPELKAERIYTTEVSWEQRLSRKFKSLATLYHYNMTNLVDVEYHAEGGYYQYENLGEAETFGVELETSANLSEGWSSFIRYSYQYTTDQDERRLSNSPEHLLKAGVTKKINRYFNIALEYQFESARITNYGNKTNSVHYAQANLFSEVTDNLRISLLVRNLFNSSIRYPSGLQFRQDTILQPGRNYLFTIEYIIK